MKQKVCVAMSGGVDSTTTAHLLKQQGYDVFGMTMYLFDVPNEQGQMEPPSFLEDAKRAANELGMAHYIVDLRDRFKTEIIEPFVEAYKAGHTPNPCAICNAKIKYGIFMDEALKKGADYMATGHYVKLMRHESDGKIHLHESQTYRKDQSFFLYGVSQHKLEKLLLPLGQHESKEQTRALAKQFESSLAEKKDSLGICFTQGKLPLVYLKSILGESYGVGEVLDESGAVVGGHTGYYQFTLGQKKGFERFEAYQTSHKDFSVLEIRPETSQIVIGHESKLYKSGLKLKDIHWIHQPVLPWKGEFKIFVWGYRLKGLLTQTDEGFEVLFEEPARAIVIGQSCVIYEADEILGGGTITEIIE